MLDLELALELHVSIHIRRQAYLIFSGVFDIKVVFDVDWIVAGGVDDISNPFSFNEGSEMSTAIGFQKDTQALSVMGRDKSLDRLETGSGESGAAGGFFAFRLAFSLNHYVRAVDLVLWRGLKKVLCGCW